MCLTLLHSCV